MSPPVMLEAGPAPPRPRGSQPLTEDAGAGAAPVAAECRGRVSRWELPMVALATIAYLLPIVPAGLGVYDEGVLLYGATRVLAGEVPYHDFFAVHGPGKFYLTALLLGLFGQEMLAARLAALAGTAVQASALYLLSRRAGASRGWSFLPVAALLLHIQDGYGLQPGDYTLTLTLLVGVLVTGRDRRRLGVLTIGLTAGIAALFRPDFGLLAAGAAGAVELRRLATAAVTARDGGEHRAAACLGHLGWLAGGFALPVTVGYGALAARGPFRLIESLVLTPAAVMPFASLPYLSSLRQIYWLLLEEKGITPHAAALAFGQLAPLLTPVAATLLCLTLLVPRIRARVLVGPRASAVLLFLGIAGVGFAMYGLGRTDPPHLFPLQVVSTTMSAIVLSALFPPTASAAWRRAVAAALPVMMGLSLGMVAVARPGYSAALRPVDLPRARGIVVQPSQVWITEAVRTLQAHAGGQPILVAGTRHDRGSWNAVILYFLSGHRAGTFHHELIPGIVTTAEVQRRIVEEVRRSDVRAVLVWKVESPPEPNRSRDSSGVLILDRFLASDYRPVVQTSHYDILVRRD